MRNAKLIPIAISLVTIFVSPVTVLAQAHYNPYAVPSSSSGYSGASQMIWDQARKLQNDVDRIFNSKAPAVNYSTTSKKSDNSSYSSGSTYRDVETTCTEEQLVYKTRQYSHEQVWDNTFYITSSGTYTGHFCNDKRTGKGKMTYNNGTVYDGEWKDDKPNGWGTMTWKDNSKKQYTGNWMNGEMEKHGTMTYTNGDQYSGDWYYNSKHGYGAFTSAAGVKKEGWWSWDKESTEAEAKGLHDAGNGLLLDRWQTVNYPGGDRYDGQIDDETNRKEGYGMMVWANGDKYTGQWHRDKRDGIGVVELVNGNRYEGEMMEDFFQGKGRYTFKESGNVYEGSWDWGKRAGTGTMFYKDGRKFTGDWKDDKREGLGTEYDATGKETRKGYWKEGVYDRPFVTEEENATRPENERDGRYVERWPNRMMKLEGHYKQGVRDGYFTYYYDNGNTERRVWYRNGKPWDIDLEGNYDGSKVIIGSELKDGEGYRIICDGQGKWAIKVFYKDGVEISRKVLDKKYKNGNVVDDL